MIKHHIPPLSVSMWSLFTSSIFTSVCSTVFYSEYSKLAGLSWQVWYGVFYGGIIGACVPWTLGTLASKLVKPTVVVIHGTMLPIWTNILSFILLGEIIPWYAAVGATVIITGVILVAYAKYKENKDAMAKSLAEQQLEPEPVELKELDNVLDQNIEEP
jgi:drug/metabolite transporter (DMT)-like permease